MRDVLSELVRRRVFRSAGAYLVIAWLIVQAGDIILPVFVDTPDWLMRALITLLSAASADEAAAVTGTLPQPVADWLQSDPTPTDGCGSGTYAITLTSLPSRATGWCWALWPASPNRKPPWRPNSQNSESATYA